jgi:hypothetical protein
VALDKNRWLAVVNTAINISLAIKCGEFLDYMRN